ncbi:hypothetical protein BJ508DRAFT_414597, partial [Ascobolus immersus RN42]
MHESGWKVHHDFLQVSIGLHSIQKTLHAYYSHRERAEYRSNEGALHAHYSRRQEGTYPSNNARVDPGTSGKGISFGGSVVSPAKPELSTITLNCISHDDCKRLRKYLRRKLSVPCIKFYTINCSDVDVQRQLRKMLARQSRISKRMAATCVSQVNIPVKDMMQHAWLLITSTWYLTFNDQCRDIEMAERLLKEACMLYFDVSNSTISVLLDRRSLEMKILSLEDIPEAEFFTSIRKFPAKALLYGLQHELNPDGALSDDSTRRILQSLDEVYGGLRKADLKRVWRDTKLFKWDRISELVDDLDQKIAQDTGAQKALYFTMDAPREKQP